MSTRTQSRAATRFGIGATCVAALGLLLVAVGTLLPWVVSGAVLRDSYQSISVIRTIRAVEGNPLELVLDGWTMIIPVIVLCAIGYAFGVRRVAATISTILAIICGTIAGAATVVGGGEDVGLGIAEAGPITMLIGSVLTVIGVVGIFAGRRGGATGDVGGEP
ncbi:hypothetical protein [Actinophytocola sp.]|uniref:hypothetical protein n=1 Tax=Actinophytocola sp. TaxID=1872138 RepID=UPI003D6B31FA